MKIIYFVVSADYRILDIHSLNDSIKELYGNFEVRFIYESVLAPSYSINSCLTKFGKEIVSYSTLSKYNNGMEIPLSLCQLSKIDFSNIHKIVVFSQEQFDFLKELFKAVSINYKKYVIQYDKNFLKSNSNNGCIEASKFNDIISINFFDRIKEKYSNEFSVNNKVSFEFDGLTLENFKNQWSCSLYFGDVKIFGSKYINKQSMLSGVQIISKELHATNLIPKIPPVLSSAELRKRKLKKLRNHPFLYFRDFVLKRIKR